MATVNVDLYFVSAQGRFVTSLTDGTPPTLPPIVAGDTWAITVYFVVELVFAGASLFAIERVQAVIGAQIRAAPTNTFYALALASGEVPSSTDPLVERIQAGTASVPEIQRITLSPALLLDPPDTRSSRFKIVCSGAGSGGRGGGTSAEGPGDFIYPNWTAEQIRALEDFYWRYYQGNDGPHDGGYMRAHFGAAFRSISVETTYASSGALATITIHFGDVYGGANWWNTDIHLVTVDDTQALYKFGWAISLPFTGASFSDYLTHGPSYLDITRDTGIVGSIQIAGAAIPPSFSSANPTQVPGYVNTVYNFAYQVAGFPAPTFALTSGVLPDGLTLSSTGHISGTPTKAGTYDGVVTATNSTGTATQSFSIAINTGGGGIVPPIGGGGSGALASYRNGNFDALVQSDGPYFEDRNDEWPGLIIWHIPYAIDFDHYLDTIPPVGGRVTPFGFFWKDTPVRFIADGVVEFERLFHNIPGDTVRAVSASKTIQEANYTTQAGRILDFVINSYSKEIEANCSYHYALDDPGTLPAVPFIQIIPYILSFKQITDFGTGFPRGTLNGIPNLFTDNKGYSTLPGGSVVHVLGRLYCRMILAG